MGMACRSADRIVESHGGRLSAGECGPGATFQVSLPMHQRGQYAVLASSTSPRNLPAREGRFVYVVDDDASVA